MRRLCQVEVSFLLTFIAWVVLCFYFLLFFFYLINILLRDSSSRVFYTINWISDSLSLSIVSSISSLASTFQDVIYYSSASVFQPMIRIIIGIISIDHRNSLLLYVEPVCAFSSRFNILHYIHIHHMGIVWLLFIPYYPQYLYNQFLNLVHPKHHQLWALKWVFLILIINILLIICFLFNIQIQLKSFLHRV